MKVETRCIVGTRCRVTNILKRFNLPGLRLARTMDIKAGLTTGMKLKRVTNISFRSIMDILIDQQDEELILCGGCKYVVRGVDARKE